MKVLTSIVVFTLKENLKTKIYLILLIFTAILIFIGLLLTGLSGFEQPQRVLVNTGIAAIELFCLFLILLNSVNLLLQDIETKSIYIILSKPVSRTEYVVGKYLGLLLVTVISILVMCAIHIGMLKFVNWRPTKEYLLTMLTIFLKTGIIASISTLATISMTSQTVAIIISLLLWIAGHFVSEILFLASKVKIVVLQYFLKFCCYIIPNFQYFNIKDYLDTLYFLRKFNILLAFFYWVVYNAIILSLSCVMFKKKDL